MHQHDNIRSILSTQEDNNNGQWLVNYYTQEQTDTETIESERHVLEVSHTPTHLQYTQVRIINQS